MAIEYQIDFTSTLPQKNTPRLNEVQNWLNYSLKEIGRGNIIVQIKPRVFVLNTFCAKNVYRRFFIHSPLRFFFLEKLFCSCSDRDNSRTT